MGVSLGGCWAFFEWVPNSHKFWKHLFFGVGERGGGLPISTPCPYTTPTIRCKSHARGKGRWNVKRKSIPISRECQEKITWWWWSQGNCVNILPFGERKRIEHGRLKTSLYLFHPEPHHYLSCIQVSRNGLNHYIHNMPCTWKLHSWPSPEARKRNWVFRGKEKPQIEESAVIVGEMFTFIFFFQK